MKITKSKQTHATVAARKALKLVAAAPTSSSLPPIAALSTKILAADIEAPARHAKGMKVLMEVVDNRKQTERAMEVSRLWDACAVAMSHGAHGGTAIDISCDTSADCRAGVTRRMRVQTRVTLQRPGFLPVLRHVRSRQSSPARTKHTLSLADVGDRTAAWDGRHASRPPSH